MLFLLFQIREDCYALEVTHVVEVLPLVRFKPILHAPAGVVGVFNYHGSAVPLLDLSELIAGAPTQAKMGNRVILVEHSADTGAKVQVGLLVEELMETIRRTAGEFVDSGAALVSSPYLGSITMDQGRIIHQIEVGKLLSNSIYDRLFPKQTVSV